MRSNACPFCNVTVDEFSSRIIRESNKFFLIYSKFEVAKGHLLIIPKNHYENLQELTSSEWKDFGHMIKFAINYLEDQYNVDGMNIGWNVNEAGGQTIRHIHCHLIPRYKGDVENPVGGIRNVIPGKGDYPRNEEQLNG